MRWGFLALALLGALTVQAAVRRETVQWVGRDEQTLTGVVSGRDSVDYVVGVRPGQTLAVRLRATHQLTQFSVLPPGSAEPMFVGEDYGARFEQVLNQGGEYTVRIGLVRSAARRNESSRYQLDLRLPGATTSGTGMAPVSAPAGAAPGTFARTLEGKGISFFVTSPNAESGNSVTITPVGLGPAALPVSAAAAGRIGDAALGDIDGDGAPEVYVSVQHAAPDARVDLLAWGVRGSEGLTPIALQALDAKNVVGYLGHDQWTPVEGMLVRRFPVFGQGGNPAAPTGKTRQLHYALEQAASGWRLHLTQGFDY